MKSMETVLDRSGSKIVMASRASRRLATTLKPLTVECVEPPQDSVVTRRSLGIVAGVPNRVLVSAG